MIRERPPCVFPLVLRPESERVILCVHPGGIPSRAFRELAEADPEAEVLVAELSANLRFVEAGDPKSAPEGVIAALARDVMDDAAKTAPGRRIVALTGWSFGGVIAHEIALRMAEEGAQPALLVIDTIAPVRRYRFDWLGPALSAGRLAERAGQRACLDRWFVHYLNALKGARIPMRPREAARLHEEAFLATLLCRSIRAGAFAEGTPEAGFAKVYKEFRRGMTRNIRLLAHYEPDGPKRDIVLVRASRPFFPIFRLFRAMGWDSLAARLRIHTISGDHYQLAADPACVRRIARLLQGAMKRSDASQSVPASAPDTNTLIEGQTR